MSSKYGKCMKYGIKILFIEPKGRINYKNLINEFDISKPIETKSAGNTEKLLQKIIDKLEEVKNAIETQP